MRTKIFIIISVLGMMFGLVSAQSKTSPQVTTTLKPMDITYDKVLCLQDTNQDTIITVNDNSELFIATIEECMKNGGAPGNPASIYEVQFKIQDVFYILREKIAAAVYYFGSKYNTERTDVNLKNTGVFDTTNTMKPSPVSNQVSGNVYKILKSKIGILDQGALADIAKDRARSGVDKKKYEKDKYMCGEFARDLEKSNPEKYTFTFIRCEYKTICIDKQGKKHRLLLKWGHFINDVHLANAHLGFVEPQSGKEVDMDANGDGKINGDDKDLVASQGGIQHQMAADLEKFDDLCDSLDTGGGPVKCTVQNYESAKDMWDKEKGSKKIFPPNFNPN